MTLLALIGGGSVWADGYRVGFDTSLDVSNTARRINSIKLNDDTKVLEESNKMYRDLHETVVFEVAPGANLAPAFVLNGGGWMHGMVYVDLNQNGDFAAYDGNAYTLDANENVSNSASSGNLGSTFSCGSFTAPTTAGDYRMRFKTDWNGGAATALNPAGRVSDTDGTYSGTNSIVANSGSIVDVTLRVVNDFSKVTFTFDGVATGSTTVDVKNGLVPTLPVTIPSYVEYTVTPALAAVTGDVTYTVTTSYNSTIPFTPNEGINYNLNINRSPSLKVYTEGEEIKTVAGTAVTYENQNNFMWQFEGDWLNGFKLKNRAADKYVTFGSVSPANKYTATLTDAPVAGAFYDLVINNGFNYLKIHGTTNDAYISNNGGAGTTFLTNWNSSSNIGDAGAQILISEATEIPFDLTAIKAEAIASLPNISALYDNTDLSTATSAINAVTCGADEASINTALATINSAKVAYMKAAEGKKIAFKSLGSYSTRGGDYYLTAEAAGTQMTSNTELTKYAVYELTYNESAKAYTVKALANDTYLPKTGNGSSTVATTDNASNAGLYTFASTGNPDQRVVITNINGSGISDSQGGIHLDASKKIVVWGPSGDASNWNIEAVSDDDWTALNAWAEFETLVNELQAVTFGDGLGQYTTGDAMMDAYAPYYIEEFASYLDDKENTDAEDFEYAMSSMQGIKENMTLNLPQAGSFLVIQGTTGNKYMNGHAVSSEESVMWYGEDNKLITYRTGFGFKNTSEDATISDVANTQTFSEAQTPGTYLIVSNATGVGQYMYENTSAVDRYSEAAHDRKRWNVSYATSLPITLTAIDGKSYSTFFCPVAVTLPTGVQAYVVTKDSETHASLALIGNVIPANTGVVLYSKDGATSANLTIGGEAGSETSELTGNAATIAAVECATLQNGANGVGLYKFNGSTLKGFKAYLPASSGIKSMAFNFDEETLIKGIEEAELKAGNIYDMSGRQVGKAQKGLYIQNGKKFIVK